MNELVFVGRGSGCPETRAEQKEARSTWEKDKPSSLGLGRELSHHHRVNVQPRDDDAQPAGRRDDFQLLSLRLQVDSPESISWRERE
jgi:hypothetical protein